MTRDVVIDTDVASRLIRHRLTGPLASRIPGMRVHVSFVTVGELWKWAALRDLGPATRLALVQFLHRVNVLPYGEAVAKLWGETQAAAQLRGRVLPTNDSWIAACCMAREMPLATFNGKDYAYLAEHAGLTLLRT